MAKRFDGTEWKLEHKNMSMETAFHCAYVSRQSGYKARVVKMKGKGLPRYQVWIQRKR